VIFIRHFSRETFGAVQIALADMLLDKDRQTSFMRYSAAEPRLRDDHVGTLAEFALATIGRVPPGLTI
jgi:hypothetical protein